MKTIIMSLTLIALAMSSFTGCSKNSYDDANATLPGATPTAKTYLINALENKDIPSNASMLAQTKDTKVKITRNVESDIMNVYVLNGRVMVTEANVSRYRVYLMK